MSTASVFRGHQGRIFLASRDPKRGADWSLQAHRWSVTLRAAHEEDLTTAGSVTLPADFDGDEKGVGFGTERYLGTFVHADVEFEAHWRQDFDPFSPPISLRVAGGPDGVVALSIAPDQENDPNLYWDFPFFTPCSVQMQTGVRDTVHLLVTGYSAGPFLYPLSR